jgi:hypothetical protein
MLFGNRGFPVLGAENNLVKDLPVCSHIFFNKFNKNSTPLGLFRLKLFYIPVAPGAIQIKALRAYATKQFCSSGCTGSYLKY